MDGRPYSNWNNIVSFLFCRDCFLLLQLPLPIPTGTKLFTLILTFRRVSTRVLPPCRRMSSNTFFSWTCPSRQEEHSMSSLPQSKLFVSGGFLLIFKYFLSIGEAFSCSLCFYIYFSFWEVKTSLQKRCCLFLLSFGPNKCKPFCLVGTVGTADAEIDFSTVVSPV